MKRSEAIKKLHMKICDKWDLPFGEYNMTYDQAWKKFYTDIMDCLEKDLGMNPPYRAKTAEEKTKIDAINQFGYCHRWDPED